MFLQTTDCTRHRLHTISTRVFYGPDFHIWREEMVVEWIKKAAKSVDHDLRLCFNIYTRDKPRDIIKETAGQFKEQIFDR